MVTVTRFDGSQLLVNDELIEFIEVTPDTVLSLTSGRKIVVREGAEEIIDRIIQYHRRIQIEPTIRRLPTTEAAVS